MLAIWTSPTRKKHAPDGVFHDHGLRGPSGSLWSRVKRPTRGVFLWVRLVIGNGPGYNEVLKKARMTMYQAYSDGGCKGNPGPGGWGCVVDDPTGVRRENKGGDPLTTNNKMELPGAIEALRLIPPGATVRLMTDSQYVIKGITEWLPGWKRKGWRSTTGPVKNKELWETLDAEVQKRSVQWEWVRGHTGHPENERCDELANEAIAELKREPEVGLGTNAVFEL